MQLDLIVEQVMQGVEQERHWVLTRKREEGEQDRHYSYELQVEHGSLHAIQVDVLELA